MICRSNRTGGRGQRSKPRRDCRPPARVGILVPIIGHLHFGRCYLMSDRFAVWHVIYG